MSSAHNWASQVAAHEQVQGEIDQVLHGEPAVPVVSPAAILPAPQEPHRSIDLDQLQEVAWAIVGAALYLLGVVAAAYGFGAWLGVWAAGVTLLVAGGLPASYTLAKAIHRRAERERRAAEGKYRGEGGVSPTPDIPFR